MDHVILVLERALDEKKLAARRHQPIAVVDSRRSDDVGDEDHTLPLGLLRPYPEEEIRSWRVNDDVWNTRNNWPEMIEPVPESQPKTKKPAKLAKPKEGPPALELFD